MYQELLKESEVLTKSEFKQKLLSMDLGEFVFQVSKCKTKHIDTIGRLVLYKLIETKHIPKTFTPLKCS